MTAFSRIRISVLSTVVAASALLGAGTALAADKLTVVTSSQSALATTAYVASQAGFFAAQGLDVTIIDGGGGSNAVNTLVSGSAQVALVGIKLASQAVEKGQNLKAVGAAIQGFPNYVVVGKDWYAKSGLKASSPLAAKAAALRGKTIAVNDIGGSSGEFARYVLNLAGVPASEVTIINMASSAARLAALKRHKIDAIVGGDVEPQEAELNGYGVTLINPARDIPSVGKLVYMVHVVKGDYLAANTGVVERYLRAIAQSQALAQKDPAAAKKAFFAFLSAQTRGAAVDPRVADAAWTSFLPFLPTGLRLELPLGYEGQVRPRSGLALKSGVTVLNAPGTIDSDYRGEVSVILINHGTEPFEITRGARIAQLVVAPVTQAVFVEAPELVGSVRGTGGFGSTGVQGAGA